MMKIRLGDNVVDLEQRIRLMKPARPGVPAFKCDGVLAEPPEAEVKMNDVMRVRLVFHGGATAEWVPDFGDVIINVEEEE